MRSLRKQRARVQRMQQAMCRRRREAALEAEVWDRSPAAGREFGSPDFESLMAEDHQLSQGVFHPAARKTLDETPHRVLRAKR